MINCSNYLTDEYSKHLPDALWSRKLNIMDNILAKMEMYAENLEELVETRTDELMQEKKKTDRLLYSMLPR